MNPSHPTNNQDPDELDELFPTWFKKIQVAFSGELPATVDERQQVFVIPYHMFKVAIESQRATWERQARIDLGDELLPPESNIVLAYVTEEYALAQKLTYVSRQKLEQPNPEERS